MALPCRLGLDPGFAEIAEQLAVGGVGSMRVCDAPALTLFTEERSHVGHVDCDTFRRDDTYVRTVLCCLMLLGRAGILSMCSAGGYFGYCMWRGTGTTTFGR